MARTHNLMFGDLRALLARKDNQQRWRQDASALLFESYALSPERHIEQWVPYLRAAPERWSRPLLTLSDPSALKRWRAIVPCATFTLEFEPEQARIEPSFFEALHEHGGFMHVHELRLDRAMFSCEHVHMLLKVPGVEDIRQLSLSENMLGDEGAHLLARSPRLKNLEGLILYTNALSCEGTRALIQSPWLAQLTYLSLSTNRLGGSGPLGFGDEGVVMRPLRVLLNGCAIGDEEALELASSRCLSALQVLALKWNPISATGRAALARSPFLPEQVKRSCAV